MSVFYGRALTAGGGTSPIERLRFTYTGQYNERLDDGVVELYTGGVFTVPKDVLVDLFLVGGGGAGGRGNSAAGSNAWPGGGGGGGYTKTVNSFSLHAGTEYTVVIGNGGSTHGADGESTSFGINSVPGGKGGYESTDVNNPHAGAGGAGGSGGGGAVSGSSVIGSGGSDGSDGSTGYPVTSVYGIGGKGQGTTTREFGEPTGKLYAGGGGGGRYSTSDTNQSPGGEGGGGTGSWAGSNSRQWTAGTPGEPRTGGGGGGGVRYPNSGWQDSFAAGGSGIVCIRLHKEKERLNFTYTGDYTEREDGVVELKSSGALTFQNPAVIDLFMVGGGGAGGYGNSSYSGASGGYGGGGGGYTRTVKKVAVSGRYDVTIGAGGAITTSVGGSGGAGGTTSFGNVASVDGGRGATNITSVTKVHTGPGAAGGSGGGGGVAGSADYGKGGSDGSNGESGYNSGGSSAGGAGQGMTTREFGESGGKLYAGGGGGGRSYGVPSAVVSPGGAGGGGNGAWSGNSQRQTATEGAANTGGGGGGGAFQTPGYTGASAAGGSGIVCLRVAAPLPELAGTWMLNEWLSMPEKNFEETLNFQATNKDGSSVANISKIFTENNKLKFMIPISATAVYEMYDFTTNTWNTAQNQKLPRWIFSIGATASDEFRTWLVNNAVKQ